MSKFASCRLRDLRLNKGRKDMIKIGDVCPLFFRTLDYAFGVEGNYMQRFHSSDVILLQVLADGGEVVTGTLNDKARATSSSLFFPTYNHNDHVRLYYTVLTSLSDSVYTVTVDGIGESKPFCVCSSDALLEGTTLMRYSHKDNNSAFDNIFWIGDVQQFFEFRVEAGFKPGGFLPQVSNEQYRNQRQEIVELYAMPYEQWTLTCGSAEGVPYYVLGLINRILCLSDVEIGGRKYVRSESSVFEITQVLEDGKLVQGTIVLEPQENEVSGLGGTPEAASPSNVVSFRIDNPKDGQMLQYRDETSSFENVTTVEV